MNFEPFSGTCRLVLVSLACFTISACDTFGDAGCDDLEDESTSRSFTIKVTNNSMTTKFLGPTTGCGGGQPPFGIEFEGRPLNTVRSQCGMSCENITLFFGCPTLCQLPEPQPVQPGETVSIPWDTTFVQMREVPLSCGPDDENGTGTCEQFRVLPDNEYTLRLEISERVPCDGTVPTNCTGPNGTGFTAVARPAQSFTLPEEDELEFVIE